MKIYVVSVGDYDEYCNITATTDKELAERLRKKFNAYIEEYECAEECELPLWCCAFDTEGQLVRMEREDDNSHSYRQCNKVLGKWGDRRLVYVTADNPASAVKKAEEKYAEYLKEEMNESKT